ncbi:MAG: phosphodiesterase, family [Firmicutes bacterium]|nr:phosphodiesterase, family [Bacillota bacterium]
MLIGVISDTHRYNWVIEEAVRKMGDVDMIVHLGDNVQDVEEIAKYFKGKIISVRGNCDMTKSVPAEIIDMIQGKKFLITHGHRYNVKNSMTRLKFKALEADADVVLFGHTHASGIAYEDGIWFVNPGSPAVPRDGLFSVAVIKLTDGEVKASIIEL